MKLSIVILNYNVRYFLELCLKSVQAAIVNIDAEIIVIDNNSEDESCHMLKDIFPDVKLIENKQNHGFSKGNNIGVNMAKGEYLCILNPDTVVAEDTFTSLLKFCEGKEKLGAVGCKLINGVGVFLPESKRNIPYVKAAFKKLFSNSSEYYANHLAEDAIGQIDVLVGAFMFLRRDLYNKVGGFDEDYFMYVEDVDFSKKLQKQGKKILFYANYSYIHFVGFNPKREIKLIEGYKIYARKHFSAFGNVVAQLMLSFNLFIKAYVKKTL